MKNLTKEQLEQLIKEFCANNGLVYYKELDRVLSSNQSLEIQLATVLEQFYQLLEQKRLASELRAKTNCPECDSILVGMDGNANMEQSAPTDRFSTIKPKEAELYIYCDFCPECLKAYNIREEQF